MSDDKRDTIPGAPWKWLYREGTWFGKLCFFGSILFVLFLLFGCQTVDPCTTCIGPYDVTLNSHREALAISTLPAR